MERECGGVKQEWMVTVWIIASPPLTIAGVGRNWWWKTFRRLLQKPRPVNTSADAIMGGKNPVHI